MLDWLLDSDPSVKWQVERDLLQLKEADYMISRNLIASKGWGKKLFSYQNQNTHMWAGGIYSPKWQSTTYTILSLMRIGLNTDNPQALNACRLFLDQGHYHDGGWNCNDYRHNVKHSSFHTTINVMEGLLTYSKKYNQLKTEIKTALNDALEFILEHDVYKSSTTKEVFDIKMTYMAYPHRWKYDAFRFLDFLVNFDFGYDKRFEDAIALLLKKRTREGFWKMQGKYSGKIFFDFETYGKISKINTYRALQMLVPHKNLIQKLFVQS